METVVHDGRATAYRDVEHLDGDATILYVHGSGGSHRVWGHQYGPDGPVHPAVAVDLSGHGDSEDVETDAGPATLDAYAADVAAVVDETDANVLVGNSLGGAVVLTAVLDGLVAPDGLVLAGTGAKLAVAEPLREWLADDFERAVEFLHGEDRLFHDADERTVERSKEQMRTTGQAVTRRDFLSCHTFDVRDRLGEIDVPTLAVVGEHDSLTPPSYHEFFAAEIPDCEYVEIERAAHLAMAERPAAFNEVLASFVGDR
ncbi:alpha/beta hydrolase [Haloarculaceae archaeon H-GB2-1]|nr:alpha/beta hydrolase [Haloarculaceae archaeon H-GB1-1]MEA5408556.1 alpha/beta hydrolase [Haloarculaceae archaeon H-GB2-1]